MHIRTRTFTNRPRLLHSSTNSPQFYGERPRCAQLSSAATKACGRLAAEIGRQRSGHQASLVDVQHREQVRKPTRIGFHTLLLGGRRVGASATDLTFDVSERTLRGHGVLWQPGHPWADMTTSTIAVVTRYRSFPSRGGTHRLRRSILESKCIAGRVLGVELGLMEASPHLERTVTTRYFPRLLLASLLATGSGGSLASAQEHDGGVPSLARARFR